MNILTELRQQKDQFFKEHAHSPLTAAQKEAFKGLEYFPETAGLIFELAVERFENAEAIQMQTSTGDFQEYQRYGKIHFMVDEQVLELTIFVNEHGYFLPFVDGLAGTQTYPAGRYLEPELLPEGRVLVDFNQAYNPYCAYNDGWSCPLTPFENRLSVPIRAGEKIFKVEKA